MMSEVCCWVDAAVSEPACAYPAVKRLRLQIPREDEVLVKVVATGICQTDLAMHASSRVPKPVVLGHEGAGIVEMIGSGVTRIAPGDRVVLSFASCGACNSCLDGAPAYCRHTLALNFGSRRRDGSVALHEGEREIGSHFFGQSSFATRTLAYERSCVRVPDDVPLEMLGPLGCGLQTGAGTVLNTLRLRPRHRVAILGVGAVGQAAVMAAALSGVTRIAAIDVFRSRLDLAHDLGSTDEIDVSKASLGEALASQFPEGLDAVIDTSGHVESIRAAALALAPRGRLALISSAKGADVGLPAGFLMAGGRQVLGPAGRQRPKPVYSTVARVLPRRPVSLRPLAHFLSV
jgi:aryl-alcohol dehydrogenase